MRRRVVGENTNNGAERKMWKYDECGDVERIF